MRRLLLLSLLLPAACRTPTPVRRVVEQPVDVGTLQLQHPPTEIWMNAGRLPLSLDPATVVENAETEVAWNLFAGLAQINPATLLPEPDVAQGWDISTDGLRYTFYLRPSVWSDGTPLTAGDFEWAWKRVLDPRTAAPQANALYAIKNAAPVHQGAVLVTGLPPGIDVRAVRTMFESVIPVAHLHRSSEPTALFVYPAGGDAAERSQHAIAAARELDGHELLSTTVRVTATHPSMIGVRASDELTLVVELERPTAEFFYYLASVPLLPVPRHVTQGTPPDEDWTATGALVSNGPYQLAERREGAFLFEKNRSYWDAARIRLDRVVLKAPRDAVEAVAMYRRGELDWTGPTGALPSDEVRSLVRHPHFYRHPSLAVDYYIVNTRIVPLDDTRVRRALSLAIDRKVITEEVLAGSRVATANFSPEGLAGYDAPDAPLFAPERARALLAEGGYPGGKAFPRLALLVNDGEGHGPAAQTTQEMWKEYLGVAIDVEVLPWPDYVERLMMGDFQIARLGWISDYADPYGYLQLLLSENDMNLTGWSSTAYDGLLAQSEVVSDPEERLQLLAGAEELALQAQPIIPLSEHTLSYLLKPYVRGVRANREGRYPWKHLWIDAPGARPR